MGEGSILMGGSPERQFNQFGAGARGRIILGEGSSQELVRRDAFSDQRERMNGPSRRGTGESG
jgi:hypothetical protein